MSFDGPILTNASPTRFLFGSFEVRSGAWIFNGSVVTGAGFAFDAATGLPVAGEVAAIALQTRSETAILVTHATRHYPDHDVAVLNHVYDDSPTDWFDPALVFETAAAAQPSAKAPKTRGTEPSLDLETGDILTRDDMREIFGPRLRKLGQMSRTVTRPDVDFWDIDPDLPSAVRASA